MDEDESDENIEEITYGISPESVFIDIFDCILFICSLFSLFYLPYRLAKTNLIVQDNEYLVLSMIYLSEIIYILSKKINNNNNITEQKINNYKKNNKSSKFNCLKMKIIHKHIHISKVAVSTKNLFIQNF